MKVKRSDFAKAVDDDSDPWVISDLVLYGLCSTYPDHRNAKAVSAKMLLIGRAYAAAAERGRSKGENPQTSNDDFYTKQLPSALRGSQLDRIIEDIRSFERIDVENAHQVLRAHTELMRVLRQLTGMEKRSLASKYLHFHLPSLFFIYDSRACQALRSVSGRHTERSALRGSADPEYMRFVSRALRFRDDLRSQFGEILTPRQVDRVLLAIESRTRRRSTAP